MSLDKNTVRKIASLACIELSEADLDRLTPRVAGIVKWVDQLQAVNTDGVEPLANVVDSELHLREDIVTDGNCQDKVLANAPESVGGYFVVPKIVEQEG